MSLRTCHLVIGGLGLVLFILQGQYMARILEVANLPDAARMMYRSAHIYFLLSCLINIGIGAFMHSTPVLNRMQRLVSVTLLVAPAMLLWSFFTESENSSLERPITQIGLYLLFGSGAFMLLQECYRKFKSME